MISALNEPFMIHIPRGGRWLQIGLIYFVPRRCDVIVSRPLTNGQAQIRLVITSCHRRSLECCRYRGSILITCSELASCMWLFAFTLLCTTFQISWLQIFYVRRCMSPTFVSPYGCRPFHSFTHFSFSFPLLPLLFSSLLFNSYFRLLRNRTPWNPAIGVCMKSAVSSPSRVWNRIWWFSALKSEILGASC